MTYSTKFNYARYANFIYRTKEDEAKATLWNIACNLRTKLHQLPLTPSRSLPLSLSNFTFSPSSISPPCIQDSVEFRQRENGNKVDWSYLLLLTSNVETVESSVTQIALRAKCDSGRYRIMLIKNEARSRGG